MGVFSRLFSRHGDLVDALPDGAEGSDEEKSDPIAADSATRPRVELSHEEHRASVHAVTGHSGMAKRAQVRAQSAARRSERDAGPSGAEQLRANVHKPADSALADAEPPPTTQPRRPVLPAREPGARLPRPNRSSSSSSSSSDRMVTGRDTSVAESTLAEREANQVTHAELDRAFAQWTGDDDSKAVAIEEVSAYEGDQRALLDTFASIAKLHIQPLRELMYQLCAGCTPRAWVAQSRPVLAPLLDAARQMGASELFDALSELDTALGLAAAETTALVGPVSRDAIQHAFVRLGTHLPDTFGPTRSIEGRRLLLLEALLLQVPKVRRRELTKLYAAGIGSVQQLLQGSPEELSRAAGLDHQLACAIIDHVARFARERAVIDPARLRRRVVEQLHALVARLSQLQSEFERADSADNQVRKKAVRRARDAAVLELHRLVAELGEVDLLEELKRCSVRAKIALLQSHLQGMKRST